LPGRGALLVDHTNARVLEVLEGRAKDLIVSNGRTEGFNRGLRAILWRAFGMVNFRHFRLRVLDRLGRPAKA
jgi:transposase